MPSRTTGDHLHQIPPGVQSAGVIETFPIEADTVGVAGLRLDDFLACHASFLYWIERHNETTHAGEKTTVPHSFAGNEGR